MYSTIITKINSKPNAVGFFLYSLQKKSRIFSNDPPNNLEN